MTDQTPEKPYTKPTRAETNRRVAQVMELLIAGATRAQVIQYVAEKTKWGIGERQVDNYIQRANQALETEASFVRRREIGRAIRRYNHLYAKMMGIQDYKGAASVQEKLDRLLGNGQDPGSGDGTRKLLIEFATPETARPATDERDDG